MIPPTDYSTYVIVFSQDNFCVCATLVYCNVYPKWLVLLQFYAFDFLLAWNLRCFIAFCNSCTQNIRLLFFCCFRSTKSYLKCFSFCLWDNYYFATYVFDSGVGNKSYWFKTTFAYAHNASVKRVQDSDVRQLLNIWLKRILGQNYGFWFFLLYNQPKKFCHTFQKISDCGLEIKVLINKMLWKVWQLFWLIVHVLVYFLILWKAAVFDLALSN